MHIFLTSQEGIKIEKSKRDLPWQLIEMFTGGQTHSQNNAIFNLLSCIYDNKHTCIMNDMVLFK